MLKTNRQDLMNKVGCLKTTVSQLYYEFTNIDKNQVITQPLGKITLFPSLATKQKEPRYCGSF
jgi:hypothetical protein